MRRYTFSRPGDETSQVWEAGYFNDRDRDFHAMFERYLEEALPTLRQGREPPIHATAGRRALKLAHAAIQSFESGERIATM